MALTRIRAQQISNIDYKQAVRVVTTTNVLLDGEAPSSVDGVALSVNSRILVNGQTNPTQNGLYLVQTVGAGPTGTWVRTTDADSAGEMQSGMVVTVTEGNTYRDTLWTLTTDDPIVLGVSEITFQQSTSFSFGNISANGTAILANTVGDTVSFVASDNISITGNATAKTVTIGVTGIQSTSISNGASNVAIDAANANITMAVAGTANVVVVSTDLVDVTGNITASGNITGSYFFGNGSQLSGIITSVSNINNGTSNVSIDTANANVTVGVNGTGNIAVFSSTGVDVTGNLLPTANVTYDLGSSTNRWRDLWVANSTIYLGDSVLSATGNTLLVNGLSVIASSNANSLSLSGNITGGNLSGSLITGTLTTAAQQNITGLGTLNSLTVTGPMNFTGNLDITGNINATGNLNYENVSDLVVGDPLIYIGANNTGNLFDLGIIVTWNDGVFQHGGWARDASDGTWKLFGNVITEPTTTIDFTNAIYEPMLAGSVTATGNISGDYILGNGSQLTGIVAGGGIEWTTQANTAPGSPVAGDFWYDSYTDKKYQYTNDGVSNYWVDQSFPTSYSSLAVTGNIVAGNVLITGNIVGNVVSQTITANVVGSVTGNITGNVFGNLIGNSYGNSTGTLIGNVTGNLTGAVLTAAQPNITSVGTLSSLTMGGLLTGYSSTNTDVNTANDGGSFSARGNASTIASMTFHRTGAYAINMGLGVDNVFRIGGWSAANNCMQLSGTGAMTILSSLTLNSANGVTAILNGGSNGVGNIGSSTTYFNTVFAKATSAQYADLAEMYLADHHYKPGTVLVFGGVKEVTISDLDHDPRAAGVVSTQPSYLMNSGLSGKHPIELALTGRVPCQVQGPVEKGDRLVNVAPGIAGRLDPDKYQVGCVIGKSLEVIANTSIQMIEIAIGRY